MNLFTVDHIIVYIFLAITLAVGIYYSRGIQTVKSYAIADKQYNPTILAITLIASMIGGGAIIGDMIEVVDSHFMFSISILGYVASIIIMGLFVAPKFNKRFKDCISIGDIIEKLFGAMEARFAGLLAYINATGIVVAQFTLLGHFCKDFLGLSFPLSVIITSSIVIFYSAFGGIKSVTMTDVLQFMVLMVAIPMIAATVYSETNVNVADSIEHFKAIDTSSSMFLDYISLALFWIIPFHLFQAPVIQRYLMSSAKQHKLTKITLGFSFIQILMHLIVLIMLVGFMKYHTFDTPEEIFPSILNNFLPDGVRGFAIIGVIAVIMSTADSFLNAGGIILVKNVFPELNDKKRLFLIKMTTLLSGIVAIIFALENIKINTILIYIDTILVCGVAVPLSAGLFYLKTERVSFWVCILSSLISFALFNSLLSEYRFLPSLITMVIGFSSYFISHYIIHGGFKFLDGASKTPHKYFSLISIEKITHSLKLFTNLHNLSDEIIKRATKHKIHYLLFACVCYANFLYFTFALIIPKDLLWKLIGLIGFSALLCTVLVLKDVWSEYYQKKHFTLFWVFSLWYCIPFINTILLMVDNGSIYSIILFALGVFILSYLVDWVLFIAIVLLGFISGIIYSILMFDNIYLTSPEVVIVTMLIGLATISIFIRTKEYEIDELIQNFELFGGAIAHEAKSPMNSLIMSNSILKEVADSCIVLEHKEDHYKVQLSEEQYRTLKELPNLNENIGKSGRIAVDLLLLAMKTHEMQSVEDFDRYSIKESIEEAIEEFVIDKKQKKLINLRVEEDFSFEGSKTFMKATIINLIKNSFRHGGSNVNVYIIINNNNVVVRDNGKGIPAHQIEKIFQKYFTLHRSGTGIGLALCEKFMESINGYIRCESEEGEYTEFILEFAKVDDE